MTETRKLLGSQRNLTPLWIIALFVSLSEVVLGIGAIKTSGSIQIALTCFVIGFPLIVACAFFAILWFKPFVLYSPKEYGKNVDIKQFVDAIQPKSIEDIGDIVEAITKDIQDKFQVEVPGLTELVHNINSFILDLQTKAETDMVSLREEIDSLAEIHVPWKQPSDKTEQDLDTLSRRIGILQAIGATPKPENFLALGNSMLFREKHELALDAYEKAIELSPYYWLAWNNKASALNEIGSYGNALQAVEKAIQLDPNQAVSWGNKGFALNNLGHPQEALKALEKASELDPNNDAVWANIANILAGLQKYQYALDAVNKTIDLNPHESRSRNLKGFILNKIDHFSEAIELFDIAIQLDSSNQAAWSNKGFALINLTRYEEALLAANTAIELNPDIPHPWRIKGAALKGLKHYEQSKIAYEQALSLKEDFHEVLYELATIYAIIQDVTHALTYLEAAINIEPSYGKMLESNNDFESLFENESFKRLVTRFLNK